MQSIVKNKLLVVTYLMTIIYALHYGIPLYATSSFLHQYFNSYSVSMLYMLGSVGALFFSIHISKYIKSVHTYRFTALLTVSEIIITILFVLTKNIFLIGLFFIIHFILQMLLYICLNILIESFSKQAETGSIRGLFLALLNIGILISPLIGGTILSKSSFEVLYIVSSIILIPMLFLLKKYLSHVKEPSYHRIYILDAFKKAWKDKGLKAVLIASFVMECFYAVMIIYSPIYLTSLGIPLNIYLAYILPLALIPLVILPYELGILADKKFGEKEMLISGLLILSIASFLFVIIKSADVRIWVMLLFFSRIGAALVETMAFAYYFKKVGPEDSSLTTLFINTKVVATIIVGATGMIISPILSERPQIIFIILGCMLLWSIAYIIPMKDTR